MSEQAARVRADALDTDTLKAALIGLQKRAMRPDPGSTAKYADQMRNIGLLEAGRVIAAELWERGELSIEADAPGDPADTVYIVTDNPGAESSNIIAAFRDKEKAINCAKQVADLYNGTAVETFVGGIHNTVWSSDAAEDDAPED